MDSRRMYMLFIRACKSINPEKRVESVFRRYYLKSDSSNDAMVAEVLLTVTEALLPPIPARYLVKEMSPANRWLYGGSDNYYTTLKRVIISYIRFAANGEIEGYIRPLKFRIKEEIEKDPH